MDLNFSVRVRAHEKRVTGMQALQATFTSASYHIENTESDIGENMETSRFA